MRPVLSATGKLNYLYVLILLLLAGCATQPPLSDREIAQNRELHTQKLDTLQVWELSGRMSMQMEKEGWSASLHWQQDRNDFNLRVIAPFGRGTVEVSGNNDRVRLRTAENEIFEDEDVDRLLRHNLGWDIPISAMAYWVKGLPHPEMSDDVLESDNLGRITRLQQSDWLITYENYISSWGYDLPSRITLQREGVRLRLIITRWDIPT